VSDAPFTAASEREALRGAWADVRPFARHLAFLLFGALLIRLIGLGGPDLWIDEIAIRRDALAGTNASVSVYHNAHLKPVRALLGTLGDSPFVLRLWGAVLGSLAPAALALACLWWRGRSLALLAGWLSVVHPYLVYYARDGNYYGTMTLHACVQLAAFVLLLRGAAFSGAAVTLLAGAWGFWNHPFSVVFTGLVLGFSALALLCVKELRTRFLGGPARIAAVAVALLLLGTVGSRLFPGFQEFLTFLTGKVSLGGKLKNVGFTWDFFGPMLQSWTVAHFRPPGIQRLAGVLMVVPCMLWAGGLVMAAKSRRVPDRMVAALLIGAPVATMAVVFNTGVERLFYIRYISFLVPLVIVAIALAIGEIRGPHAQPGWRMGGQLLLVALVGGIWQGATVHLLMQPGDSFSKAAVAIASARRPPEDILLFDQIESSRAEYHFPRAGVPHTQPDTIYYTYRAEGAWPFAWAVAHHLHGLDGAITIDNSWARLPVEGVYKAVSSFGAELASGYAISGEEQNVSVVRFDGSTDLMLIEGLESRGEGVKALSALADRAAEWRLTGVAEIGRPRSSRLDAPIRMPASVRLEGGTLRYDEVTAPGEVRAVPNLPERYIVPARRTAQIPDHSGHRLEGDSLDTETLWRERDGTFEYMVYQPEDTPPRQLVVRVRRRAPEDIVLAGREKSQIVPSPDLWIAVAIDGAHQGTWLIPAGAPETVRIPLAAELSPGNRRIEITGFQPRLGNVPFNPWRVAGLEWNAAREAPLPSLEADGALELATPWKGARPWHDGDGLAGGFQAVGGAAGAVAVDAAVLDRHGMPALRISFGKEGFSGGVIGPARPVKEGQLLGFQADIRARAATRQELLLVAQFYSAQGAPVGSTIFGHHPAITGTTLQGRWHMVREFLPVPRGAAAVRLGFTVIPREIALPPLPGHFWISPITVITPPSGS
jgi:hypothetical protein